MFANAGLSWVVVKAEEEVVIAAEVYSCSVIITSSVVGGSVCTYCCGDASEIGGLEADMNPICVHVSPDSLYSCC